MKPSTSNRWRIPVRVAILVAFAFALAPCSPTEAEELEAMVVATSGEDIPGRAATLGFVESPVIRPPGVAYFSATGFGSAVDTGFFRASSEGLTLLVAEGDPSPDGNGNFGTMGGHVPFVNSAGEIAFFNALTGTLGGLADSWAIFAGRGAGDSLEIVVRGNQPVPDGGGDRFSFQLHLLDFNDSGAVVFKNLTTRDVHGIWRSDRPAGGIPRIVGEGDPGPRGDGVMAGVQGVEFVLTVMNQSGQVAFLDDVITDSGALLGVYRGSGAGSLAEIARQGDPVPSGDGTFAGFDLQTALSINDGGEVSFMGLLNATSQGTANDVALFRGSGTTTTELVRKGDPTPDGNGRFLFAQPRTRAILNSRGNLLFHCHLTGASGGATEGLFLAGDQGVQQIARLNQPAPGGGVFSSFSQVRALNDDDQVAFLAFVDNGGFVDVAGLFFYENGTLISIVREGDALPGFGTITEVVTSTGLEDAVRPTRRFLNDVGQVAFAFHAGNQSGIAIASPDVCSAQQDVDLFGVSIFGTELYEACNRLTAGNVTVETGGDLTLRAGSSVVLQGGFVVEDGGKLAVVVD